MTPRKTASQISEIIITQLETSLNQSIPILPKSFCRVLAKVLGGVFVLLYQYAGWILLQMFVKTASNTEVNIGGITLTPLKLWADLVGIYQKPGQRAELDIIITVITQGGTLTSGTRFVNPETEMIYTLVGDVSLDASEVSGTIRAATVGELGNVDDDTELAFVSPPSSVQKTAVVDGTATSGVDAESTEAFRERVTERYAARPQGGAYADYRDWAEEVVGVLNAYPYSGWLDPSYPGTRAGNVFVYVESSSHTDGIPPQSLLDEVYDYIEADESGLASRRNINAYVVVRPITRVEFDLSISGLVADNITAARSAIESALEDYFLDSEPYITGLSIPPRKDNVTEMLVGGVAGRIASANGGYITGITLGAPAIDGVYALQEGEKAKLGTISWT